MSKGSLRHPCGEVVAADGSKAPELRLMEEFREKVEAAAVKKQLPELQRLPGTG